MHVGPTTKTVTPLKLASAGPSIPVATHRKVFHKTLPHCVVHLLFEHNSMLVSSTLELHVCATLVQFLFVFIGAKQSGFDHFS